MTQEVFEVRRQKVNAYHRKNYAKRKKGTKPSPYRIGHVHKETGLLFWRFRDGKEYWVDRETFEERKAKKTEAWRRSYDKNKEKIRLNAKNSRKRNLERERARCRDSMRKFRENNRDEFNRASSIRNTRRTKERKKSDALFDMKIRFVSATSSAFRRRNWTKSSKTAKLLGCDWNQLKEHIESQFRDGMSWENRSQWHIDHIIPLASARNVDELSKLCHFTNLQPLWAIENIKKGHKIPS